MSQSGAPLTGAVDSGGLHTSLVPTSHTTSPHVLGQAAPLPGDFGGGGREEQGVGLPLVVSRSLSCGLLFFSETQQPSPPQRALDSWGRSGTILWSSHCPKDSVPCPWGLHIQHPGHPGGALSKPQSDHIPAPAGATWELCREPARPTFADTPSLRMQCFLHSSYGRGWGQRMSSNPGSSTGQLRASGQAWWCGVSVGFTICGKEQGHT